MVNPILTDVETLDKAIEWFDKRNDYNSDYEAYQEEFKMGVLALYALRECKELAELSALTGSIDKTLELAKAYTDGRCVVQPKYEMDISNPLESIKVMAALKSEVMKYNIRMARDPKEVSVLDYTIIKALEYVLTREDAEKGKGKEK